MLCLDHSFIYCLICSTCLSPHLSFAGIMRSYWQQLLGVSQVLALGLAKSLDLPDSFFVSKMQDPVAQMLCVRYNMQAPPPSSGATHATAATQAPAGPDLGSGSDDRLLGCGTHTDCGFMTLLCSDGEGLEVCTPQGTWVAAPVIPGALLVNLGDMAAMWTNGRYRSTPHRVLLPRIPSSSSTSHAPSRVSLVFFCNCDFYAPVRAIESSNSEEGTTAGRYMLEKLGLMYK
uniref:Fe2OG dioxygenase domain-containing protein n=2 Tax=Dunaliella tertiolecta TaxID=3047 RepID=A0A7S3VIK1_DUNTE